jgi:hypothetical protein
LKFGHIFIYIYYKYNNASKILLYPPLSFIFRNPSIDLQFLIKILRCKLVRNKNTFTPFCVENAQMATLPSLIYAHKVGVLNEKRCKIQEGGKGVRNHVLVSTLCRKATLRNQWFPPIAVQ